LRPSSSKNFPDTRTRPRAADNAGDADAADAADAADGNTGAGAGANDVAVAVAADDDVAVGKVAVDNAAASLDFSAVGSACADAGRIIRDSAGARDFPLSNTSPTGAPSVSSPRGKNNDPRATTHYRSCRAHQG
jgi:hypothetical protein